MPNLNPLRTPIESGNYKVECSKYLTYSLSCNIHVLIGFADYHL